MITKSTTLSADVVCGATDPGVVAPDGEHYALLVKANDVKLDLAGHSVTVQPAFAADFRLSSVGIYGRSGVTVKNGTLGETVFLKGAHENRLVDLHVTGFIGGIVLDGSRANRIRRVNSEGEQGSSLLLRNGSNRNVIERNDFGADNGVQLLDSDRNELKRNTSCSSTTAYNVLAGSDSNSLVRNVARCESGGGQYGFHVSDGARQNVLLRNTANAVASIHGIFVEDPTTVLIRNTANDNGELGIWGPPGVCNLGNRASGNGNPLQCVGVTCS